LDNFRFEHTLHLSEAEYVALESTLAHDSGTRWGRRVGLGVVGLALLTWPYTLLLGAAILVLLTISIVMPRYFPFATAQEYRQSRYLQQPLTYGVSSQALWIRGAAFAAEAGWNHLVVWQVKDKWLVLSASGLPRILLPVAELRAAGVYDRVIGLAREYAVEFDSREARAWLSDVTRR